MVFIYTLCDPITKDIKYVGQTTDIERRFRDHISSSINKNSKSYDTYKSRWIRKLLNNGLHPVINIIEECYSILESNSREKYHINQLTDSGSKLTNSYISDVTEFSTETKIKMSLAKKGKSLEEIVGNDRAIELKEYYSKRLKENNPNRSSEESVRSKISNTLKDFYRDKENHWAFGVSFTEEHIDNLRESHLNNIKNTGNKKPRTDEQKDRIRNKIKGTKVHRSKILQFDINMILIKEWNSIREIKSINSNLNRQLIADCCKGKRANYAGFFWKYKN